MKRWPLCFIAAPAAVAVWSGWVGLGGLCGFGVMIHPLPGIVPGLRLNTAITLPIGVEAYGAYALGAWLAPGQVPARARVFARRSAVGALVLGMTGQVIYHLLAAAHARTAPWPVVVLVSCLPVVSLGFGAALAHLLRANYAESGPVISNHQATAGAHSVFPERTLSRSASVPGGQLVDPQSVPATAQANGNRYPEAARVFADDVAAGRVPGIRRIRAELRCGQPAAQEVQAYLAALTGTS